MTADISQENVARMTAKLRAPQYWMSGSDEGHEGENDSPREAADMMEALAAERDRAIEDAIYNAQYVDLVSQYRAERDALAARLDEVEDSLQSVLDACDQGRMVEKGAGGMTIEAQIRRSVYNGVPAWPVEEARAALQEKPHE